MSRILGELALIAGVAILQEALLPAAVDLAGGSVIMFVITVSGTDRTPRVVPCQGS